MQVEKRTRALQDAQAHANDRRAQFGGSAILKLCSTLQQQSRRFHRMPIGPIGYYLTLKDNQYVYSLHPFCFVS
jgi:hypothetical protein